MKHTRFHHSQSHKADWLQKAALAPHIEAYTRGLTEQGYAQHTVDNYLAALRHFAQWMHHRRLQVRRISEMAISQFLNEHLPHCDCAGPVPKDFRQLRAALGHLLVVLRELGVAVLPQQSTTAVAEELHRFDEYMDHARGSAPRTRSMALRSVRRLLTQRFGDGPIVFSVIKPGHVRSFVGQQSKLFSAASGTSSVVSALRGYFRYRATLGDAVHSLAGAVTSPAIWQLSSLPKTLTAEEVEKLVGSLGRSGRSMRRTDAIVRCALDLGLRSGEIAKLGLDDIDWRASTITLRHTKGGREDVLPLPKTTGQAIATYLKDERPRTTNRAVFVRHIAPRDKSAGPDLIRKVIRQAYGRAGLPYTRSHLLRHTMASRLLESGSSLKEVADVLRHRSINTTMIYAKLDSRNLREVALPWPGCAS